MIRQIVDFFEGSGVRGDSAASLYKGRMREMGVSEEGVPRGYFSDSSGLPDPITDQAPEEFGYADRVMMAIDRVRSYAQRSAMKHHGPPFRPLSVIACNSENIDDCCIRMNGDVPREFRDVSMYGGDLDALYALFDVMNPADGHKEGAISFRAEDGIVDNVGVFIKCPIDYSHNQADGAFRKTREITGELGARHTAAALGSMNEGVEYALVIGKRTGAFVPYVDGNLLGDQVWVPDLYVRPATSAETVSLAPTGSM